MIKNYIFDFGNVLAEFYPEKLTAPYVSDEETLKTEFINILKNREEGKYERK